MALGAQTHVLVYMGPQVTCCLALALALVLALALALGELWREMAPQSPPIPQGLQQVLGST